MFKGMREDVFWKEINKMERNFEGNNNDLNDNNSIDNGDSCIGKFVPFLLRKWVSVLTTASTREMEEMPASTNTINMESISSTSAILPLSPQPGQAPTVFFLPGLEAIPFHHAPRKIIDSTNIDGDQHGINDCNNKHCPPHCPCSRLWNSTPLHKNSPPIRLTGDIEALQRNFEVIRKELMDLLEIEDSSFVPFDPTVFSSVDSNANSNSNNINDKKQPSWSSIYLYHQGIRQSKICNSHFPQTLNIIESQCPHRMAGKCGLGSVYFSKLEPNTKVKEHCGPTNLRWRCHLPLIVPGSGNSRSSGKSHLRVGLPDVNEECVEWKEGVPILFDDSFLHSALHVVNDGGTNNGSVPSESIDHTTNGARIVLILDFWHPSLTEADRTALGVLYPPGS